jgi:hypothetical protein
MNYDDHCINLGWLWGDLQYLEVTLRIFLTEANLSKNYITNLDTFGTLVVEYNGQLSRTERSLYSVDTTVIHIRNASLQQLRKFLPRRRRPHMTQSRIVTPTFVISVNFVSSASKSPATHPVAAKDLLADPCARAQSRRSMPSRIPGPGLV